jgi:hypothetical protein
MGIEPNFVLLIKGENYDKSTSTFRHQRSKQSPYWI